MSNGGGNLSQQPRWRRFIQARQWGAGAGRRSGEPGVELVKKFPVKRSLRAEGSSSGLGSSERSPGFQLLDNEGNTPGTRDRGRCAREGREVATKGQGRGPTAQPQQASATLELRAGTKCCGCAGSDVPSRREEPRSRSGQRRLILRRCASLRACSSWSGDSGFCSQWRSFLQLFLRGHREKQKPPPSLRSSPDPDGDPAHWGR